MALIEVKDLNYHINNINILSNINIQINEGDFIGIIGSNSSGKTTLLKLLCGILNNENKIKYNNIDLKDFGISFNDYNKFLFEDVYTELAFVLENMNINQPEIENRIIKLCDYLEITDLLDKKCVDLTNEEKQLVRLAISMIHEPKILVLDNPFSFINNKIKNKIINKLKAMQEENNLTIIISSNNLEDIVETNYTYVLDSGKVLIEGPTLEVLKEDTNLKKLGLELPFSINLSMMLNFYEVYDKVDKDYNEVIDYLWN